MNTDYVKTEFEKFDLDNDGLISLEEAAMACSHLGINKVDAKNIANSLSITPTTQVPINDFTEEIKAFCVKQLKKDPFRLMFDRLDTDRNGYIDFEEAKLAISAFGQIAKDSKVRELFNYADSNRDGLIDVEEYLQFLKKLHSKKLLYYIMSGKGASFISSLSNFI